jgi:hypothetical protein
MYMPVLHLQIHLQPGPMPIPIPRYKSRSMSEQMVLRAVPSLQQSYKCSMATQNQTITIMIIIVNI